MPEFMTSAYFVPIICLVFFVIIATTFTLAILSRKKQYDFVKNGPYAEATITSAVKRRDTLSDSVRYEWACDITYTLPDGITYNGVVFIRDMGVDVPVGGKVEIAYNPKKPDKALLVSPLFMKTPEYIALMEAKGYTYTGDSFVKKSTSTSTLTYKKTDSDNM